MRLIIAGHGMVAHHLVERLQERAHPYEIAVFGEEPRPAYDRVNLTSLFRGKTPAELQLASPSDYARAGVALHLGERVIELDRVAKRVRTSLAREFSYDKLVLATGSSPFVPPVAGRDAPGCFVYRTVEDLDQIRAWSQRARVGVVIGGGLLGLEAADALARLGLEVHVVEFAPRLMAVQLDEPGGAVLRRRIEALGVSVHTGKNTTAVELEDGRAARLRFADGGALPADLVVFSAGIRPRDELARASGLSVGERGGIMIDERCLTSDPEVLAVGECALFGGRIYGLVAPGYQMARVAASTLSGGAEEFRGADLSTKLKLMGVDVASFGDGFAAQPGARVTSFLDTTADVYKKLVLSADGTRLLGGMLVGDASSYAQLVAITSSRTVLGPHPEDLILPARGGSPLALPDEMTVCNCHNVTKSAICDAIFAQKLGDVGAVKSCTKAGTGCGSCVPLVSQILTQELQKAGITVEKRLCEHFMQTRQDLYHLVRLHKIHGFEELLARHGSGAGCEICKPAVASILASAWNEHILEKKHLPLQDTNDRFLANLQRDGSYSIVPRVPAGEITPDQLIALGTVAKRYGLYTKITGGQRVDLFGARVDQLPLIWRELVDAGFESGHAYGKALRTVKSCVGTTWCRYGVQDSVGLAIRVENRYKGLRAPHKVKAAVSGCARECAEAQGKDFGIIATELGYNLYLCGNGGMRPQHAQLFATDLDEETLIKYLDRFLMFYIRTADRLERTAPWFNKLDGGIDYLRRVIIDDALGICAELEAEMAHVVGSYQCEWRAALEDPEKLKRFRPFVNSDENEPLARIRVREQLVPA